MVHPYEEQRKNFKDSKVFKSFLNCPKIQTPTTNTNNKYDKNKKFFKEKKKILKKSTTRGAGLSCT